MHIPKADLLNLVDSLYTKLGKSGPKLSKDITTKIIELREQYFLSSIVNPLLKGHYIVWGGYKVKIIPTEPLIVASDIFY